MANNVPQYENIDAKNGIFNQAFFQMQRLNELITRADRLAINPIEFNQEFNSYNFEIIARDYQSIFLNIYAKLTQTEKTALNKTKNKIFTLLRHRSPFETKKILGQNPQKVFHSGKWDNINKELFEFRTQLEDGMEAHGLGNPDKKIGGAAMLEI